MDHAAHQIEQDGFALIDDVFDAGQLLRGFFEGERTTDGDGRMDLGSFAPGKYQLEVTQGTRDVSRGLTLPAGDPELVLRITLP